MLDRIDIKFFKLAVGKNVKKETDVDITARCPICGDSAKDKRKARLHLYTKNGVTNVNCFNGGCPVHNKTVYSFLRDFYPNLLSDYKREKFNSSISSIMNITNEELDVFSKFKNRENRENRENSEKKILVQNLSPYFKDIEDVPEALEYLKRRGITYTGAYGKWYFGYQDLKIGEKFYPITNTIIIPLYYGADMYGFYSRSIKNKKFYTYMPEENSGYKIWNWFKVDKGQPVYIFEGIFDAISGRLKNSIALMGAKLPEERLRELKEPVFVLDNDYTGLLNSLEYAKRGYKVYIQPDIFPEKDMNEFMLKNKNINTSEIILNNIYSGIAAEVRIKSKL